MHGQAALQKGPHYATRISVEEKRQEQIFDIPIFRRHSVPQHFFWYLGNGLTLISMSYENKNKCSSLAAPT